MKDLDRVHRMNATCLNEQFANEDIQLDYTISKNIRSDIFTKAFAVGKE